LSKIVKWLPEALTDIERLYAFLDKKNPKAAARAAKAIISEAELLKSNPSAGRPMQDDTRRREWFISFGAGSYVLRYMLENENTAVIIRVWHSKETRGQ
jgi:plasmid stabilization system protein ParE